MYDIIYYKTHNSDLNLGKDLNIVLLTSAKDWQAAPTKMKSFSVSCAGMCVQDTLAVYEILGCGRRGLRGGWDE